MWEERFEEEKSRIGLGSINNVLSEFKWEVNGEDFKKKEKSDVRRAVSFCVMEASEGRWAVSRKVNRQTRIEKDGIGSEISNI